MCIRDRFYPFLEEIGIQPNPYDENGKRKPEFAGKLATYTPYTTCLLYTSFFLFLILFFKCFLIKIGIFTCCIGSYPIFLSYYLSYLSLIHI